MRGLYFGSAIPYLCKKCTEMDIGARKLNFVQEFLRISDEELVDKLEKFLRAERMKKVDKEVKPMSMNEFNQMIEKAEDDAESGRVIDARELQKKVEKWK
ncbi:MAG: hypothetical protein PHD06_02900 [Bacteroidales bacterium]|nr:hypothetical protein [Bacteroidales bacterium]MDY0197203.1 hypothetical protein [Tenuifilaceae bacterium]